MMFLFVLSLPCVLLVGVSIRLCPYWSELNQTQKRRLFGGYVVVFLLGMALVAFAAPQAVSLTAYKLVITFGALATFLVDCLVLRREFYARLFILAMQVSITFFLHSVPAFFIGLTYGDRVTIPLLTAQSFLMVLLFLLLCYPLYRLFQKPVAIFRLLASEGYYWNVLWLVPAMIYGTVFLLTLNPAWIGLRELAARFMAAAAVYTIFRCVTLDYRQYQERQRAEQDNRLLTVQAQATADNLSIMRENEEVLTRFRHDLRHQLRTLMTLSESGDMQGLRTALTSMDAALEDIRPVRFCENSILNAAILFYQTDAQNKHIDCDIEVDFPAALRVEALQLAVVLSNGMENAIRASVEQKKKKIILRSRCVDGKIALDIRNRFDGTVYFDSEGVPIAQWEHHGTGTRSILAFAAQHHGMCSFSHEKGWFVLRVMVEDAEPHRVSHSSTSNG